MRHRSDPSARPRASRSRAGPTAATADRASNGGAGAEPTGPTRCGDGRARPGTTRRGACPHDGDPPPRRRVARTPSYVAFLPSLGRADHTLTGPEALRYDEVASLLSTELGRRIVFEPDSLLAHRRRLRAAGAESADVQLVIDATARMGLAAEVTPDLERLLGRPATRLPAFVAAHRGTWRPDRRSRAWRGTPITAPPRRLPAAGPPRAPVRRGRGRRGAHAAAAVGRRRGRSARGLHPLARRRRLTATGGGQPSVASGRVTRRWRW